MAAIGVDARPLGTGARRRRWTRDEYYRLLDVGILGEDDRVERIEGEIVELAPEHAPHAGHVDLARDVLARAFGTGYTVRVQHPLTLVDSDPEPDLAVVPGRPGDYLHRHPTTAHLVVEVSQSTLSYDRTDKTAVYARARIPEYWILNLVDRQLEVHRQPGDWPDGGSAYRQREVVRPGQTVRPLAIPHVAIDIADLLP